METILLHGKQVRVHEYEPNRGKALQHRVT
jgi:hypothetical protein